MESPLSAHEREALSRFVSKLIEDIDRLAALFESRGADSAAARLAQSQLQYTLEVLTADRAMPESMPVEAVDVPELQACAPENF